jgi:precorrin-2/cobalt-factor-2 C20-methyltransferase
LVGVGVGPGNPELITLRAIELIRRADVVCVPRAESKSESIAWEIVKAHRRRGRRIDMPYGMSPDPRARVERWRQHALSICGLCDDGALVVFVTLGDPGLYSTFEYVARLVRDMRPHTPIEIVPGVTSVSTTAALLGLSLAQAEETLTIQPCSRVITKPREWWLAFDCIAVMKIGRKLPLLVKRLGFLGLLDTATLVSRAGFDNETITRGAALQACGVEPGYLATLLVRPHGGHSNEVGE